VTRLEPMTQARYEVWLVTTIREYAEEKVASGNYPAEGALERSKAEFDTLLPAGLQTPGHEIRSMVDDDGEAVGYVWFTIEDRPAGRVVFIYDIAVDPAHRRKGHAQAALLEVEDYARANGCIGVMLHVFGSNAGARQLYAKAGYDETNVIMLKRVDGQTGR
jgi:ribosomal protein S18 acetylase RimI-like enzyme